METKVTPRRRVDQSKFKVEQISIARNKNNCTLYTLHKLSSDMNLILTPAPKSDTTAND
jgi:hypothetical protein